MAFNDDISGFRQSNSSSELESATERETRLANLRVDSLEKYMKLKEVLNKKSLQEEEEALNRLYDVSMKMEQNRVKEMTKFKEKQRKELAKASKKLNDEEKAEFEKQQKEKLKAFEEEQAKKIAYLAEQKIMVEDISKAFNNIGKGGKGIFGDLAEVGKMFKGLGKEGKIGALDAIVSSISDFAKKLDSSIDAIAKTQSKIDTRLYGSGRQFGGLTGIGATVTRVAGISPYVSQQNVMDTLIKYVDMGISYNVEQRAFLETLSANIATTFDAHNSTLLQLVRVQQADTTAVRLGMESTLNAFLNSMYQNTEYLSNVSTSVKSSLYEATAIMGDRGGVDFEYQVQKWLGSLYSVGMSSGSVENIASALGMLGSGDVSGLAGNSAMQNLLVMSASKAGLSYANLLTGGLTASDTNSLLSSMVEYLAEIAGSNKVVQNQYAKVFGMSMSDILSASNLKSSVAQIRGTNENYGSAMENLFGMAGSMGSRVSLGEMMANMWDNSQYSMASGVATSPVLYGLWKASGLLDSAMGGIPLPDIMAMGTGVQLNTTIADLMRVGALSGGILSSMGQMIAGGGFGGLSGAGILSSLGIVKEGPTPLVRGNNQVKRMGGETVSMSSYTGNASGSNIYDATLAGATDDKNKAMADAKQGEEDTKTLDDLHSVDTAILELLQSVVDGVSSFTVVNTINDKSPLN